MKQWVFAGIKMLSQVYKRCFKVCSKDHSFLNNECTLRGHSIIMFTLREEGGPSKYKLKQTGGEGGCISGNINIYIFLI